MSQLVLETKLNVPPVRAGLVRRPRLLERLDEGLCPGQRLVLVSAPAGCGKTTLVAEWLSSAPWNGAEKRHAWLSLDEGDNDPARFLACLVAALQRASPFVGQGAQTMLESPRPPPHEALLTSLINDIAATPSPLILVLDDYHLIHTLAIHRLLAFLLEHQPPQMRLAIISREDPPLPLPRWRARGQVVDVRQRDLQFTEEETSSFMRQVMRLDLEPSDIAALQRRTEGWIAGLQLVALSFRGRDDLQALVQSFTGSNRYVLDYLMDEVFRQQPPETQAFLLQTSILDRLTASLCDAVTGRSDGRERLLALEQANLFLLPLDQSRTWYRYHHLFVDVLRHRLQIEGGREAAALHGRASRWYAENRFPIDAIHHALAAADWEAAANLILDAHSEMMKRGEVVTLLGWFRALPEDVVHAQPELCLGFCWPLILSEQIEAAESCLAHAEQADQEDPAFLGGIATARAYIARARGDGRRAVELSQQALALLPQDDFAARSVVAANLGMAYWYAGHLAEAERVLTEALEAARRSGNSYAGGGAQFFLAKVEAARGRLQRAVDLNREVIEQGGHMPVVGVAHADLARLLYERDDLAAAEGQVRQGLELSRRVADTEFQIANLRTLALVRQTQGDALAARQALQECAALAQHPGISPPARLHALAYQALVALARGDLGAVSGLLGRAPPLEAIGSFPDYLLLSLAQARLLLAQGRRTAAADLLAARHERAAQAGFVSGVMETRALQALAAPAAEEAFACLAEALALAEPEGYLRTFLDLGEPMKELLSGFRDRGTASPAVRAYAGKLLAAFSPPGVQPQVASAAAGAAGRPGSALIEPLSERELEVLDLLSGGQTNYEIARALSVSINTVKTHLANIYGKLGVHDRRRAVARGEELGLLV